jgi:hypothetical protein
MSNSDNSGFLMILLWLVSIALSIGSGILAWNWIDPQNFGGGILFIIVWGIFSAIGYFIGMGLIALLSGMK